MSLDSYKVRSNEKRIWNKPMSVWPILSSYLAPEGKTRSPQALSLCTFFSTLNASFKISSIIFSPVSFSTVETTTAVALFHIEIPHLICKSNRHCNSPITISTALSTVVHVSQHGLGCWALNAYLEILTMSSSDVFQTWPCWFNLSLPGKQNEILHFQAGTFR